MLPAICALAERRRMLLAWALFSATLLFFLWAVRVGWRRSLLEDQGFRQTQTAISVHYMLDAPPSLAYETPVLGPPWTIPFEFPVYQWLVAGIVSLCRTPLEPTGRFVGVVFFLLTLVPANSILRSLRFDTCQRLIALSFMLVSPYYIYWSRAFLIESTALFFSASYLALTIRYLLAPSVLWVIAAASFGAIAGLVKVTTFIPFMLAALLCWLIALSRTRHVFPRMPFARFAMPLVLVATPIAITHGWTRFADAHKSQSRIGQLTTSEALHRWNFGTWEQRWDSDTWRRIVASYERMLGWGGFAFIGLLVIRNRNRRWPILAAFCLTASGPIIFANLYMHHHYYAYATGIMLVLGFGMSVAAISEQGAVARRLASLLALAFVCICVRQYFHEYYPKQSSRIGARWLRPVTQAIRDTTSPDDIIVVLGCDWSSEIPYYSDRRALMIPNWCIQEFLHDPKPFLDDLQGYRLGAILVFFDPLRLTLTDVAEVARAAELNTTPMWIHGNLYGIFLPRLPMASEAMALGRSSDVLATCLRW